MNWLDSSPIKFLNFIASVAALVSLVGGGAYGEKVKGQDWGTVAAASAGAIIGLGMVACFYAALVLIVIRLRRNCPHCQGTGRAVDEHLGNSVFTRKRCEVCGGKGKVW